MDEKVCASAIAFVPKNEPGGPYKENDYTVIPVRILDVKLNPKYPSGPETDASDIIGGIANLQEILVKSDINVPRGSLLTLEFDILALGGVVHWTEKRKEGKIIRTEPYAVEVRYEREKV